MLSERRRRELSDGKCQLLLSEKSILAAMAYLDLNPMRAKVADSVTSSKHTSIQIRGKAVRGDLKAAALPLKPLLGCQSYNLPTLIEGEYIDLVDYTGRQIYPGKRGVIKESEPKALDKLGRNAEHWAHRVQGFDEGFGARWFRVIGELEDMIEKALAIKQRTLFGALAWLGIWRRVELATLGIFCRALRPVVLFTCCGTEDLVIRNIANNGL